MKELILDKLKWICGAPDAKGDGINSLGLGSTNLCNSKGYMCCLGQFALQLNSELNEGDLNSLGKPNELSVHVPYLTQKEGINTSLSTAAIKINDNKETSISKKVRQLRSLFRKEGLRIKVIN